MLRLKTILQYNYLFLYILIFSLVTSIIRCNIDKPSKFNITDTSFVGIITSYKVDGDKFSFELKSKEKLKCTYYIKTKKEKESLSNLDLGVTLKLKGSLSEPMNNTIPNTFNYKKYLHQNNINYILSVDNVEVINNNPSIFYKIKNMIIKHINGYKSESYLKAFIIGDKSTLDEKIKDEYQNLGVSHIFAISGMHVSLLTGVILLFLRKIKINENISYFIVIIFLLFYLFLTNFQASILRSVGLFILLFLNRKFDLDIRVINILYLDIAILLLVNPNLLTNVGFQYSSIVSYSLIKYTHYIKGNYLIKTLKISLIAFLFSLPITIINNYEINILSSINNIVIVPAVSFIIYPLSVLSFIIKPLDNILLILINILELVAHRLLIVNLVFPKINIFIIIIYYILLTLFFESYKKVFLSLIILLLFIVKILPLIDQSYHVYFLDVGQGDSIVIKKGSECIMIDTGGKVDFKTEDWKIKKEYYYTDSTITFLHSIGVSKLNYVILTHGDADHMGESINLVNNFKVDKVIFNNDDYNKLEQDLIKVLGKKNIKYYKSLEDLKMNKYKLQFLSTKIYDNENDNSNVIYLDYNNYKFLFMGDAGETKEKDILEKYKISDIDFLKVGHHGSKTSSSEEFIDSINPKYSIISVGKNNRYGHPNKEVLENLEETKVYRTDLDGSVMFKIKKDKLEIETYAP